MARPTKQGLDYYPKDVKAKYDTKFKYVESKNSVIARLVIYELWDLIYGEEGYFTKFDSIQKVLFLGDLPIDENQLDAILESCFEIKMFNRSLFDKYSVLTSASIQTRYLEATARRAKIPIISEYFLLDQNSYRNIFLVNANNNRVNDDINLVNDSEKPPKKRKEKESKGKESRVKSKNPTQKKIYHYYESNGFGTISSKTKQDFDYWVEDFVKIGATEENAIALIIHALGIAIDRNKRSYGYTNGILKDWEQKRFLTVEDVLTNDKKIKFDKNIVSSDREWKETGDDF
ncbi:Lin1244/Lin1753 domain-containing protein [Enterococcus pallens]|uniref:DnaD domain-containing protein n=1 Tax=Enterococcus pallens ATCC BAA-351 TaxID=1158607 RepID=R2QHY1_9ENTE|nr:DnaD domain protein [Enterococcus pallens]EOH94798.1 DnaD domain-containing protein [Enterococcus pallens ATCC BAA-351]EOU14883.1 hypothetical protein I588_04533 [Enterococcus pallens ATCC BAA-351]OJG78145.1 DnaD domain-containing protein [Enterococcus pallens]